MKLIKAGNSITLNFSNGSYIGFHECLKGYQYGFGAYMKNKSCKFQVYWFKRKQKQYFKSDKDYIKEYIFSMGILGNIVILRFLGRIEK